MNKDLIIGEIKEINNILMVKNEFHRQGFVYKNYNKEAWDNNDIVYISEFGFPDEEKKEYIIDKNGKCWYALEECAYYKKSDFITITNDNEDWAKELFDDVDWQFPENLFDEWTDFISEEKQEKLGIIKSEYQKIENYLKWCKINNKKSSLYNNLKEYLEVVGEK